jgi:hypothetical protein
VAYRTSTTAVRGAVTRVTRPERPQNTPWRMSLATRRSTAALSLSGCSASSLCCGPQRRNSFEHFGDEKLRLKLRHVLGYNVSISAQTKRCPEPSDVSCSTTISRSIRSSKALRRFRASRSWSGTGQPLQEMIAQATSDLYAYIYPLAPATGAVTCSTAPRTTQSGRTVIPTFLWIC